MHHRSHKRTRRHHGKVTDSKGHPTTHTARPSVPYPATRRMSFRGYRERDHRSESVQAALLERAADKRLRRAQRRAVEVLRGGWGRQALMEWKGLSSD